MAMPLGFIPSWKSNLVIKGIDLTHSQCAKKLLLYKLTFSTSIIMALTATLDACHTSHQQTQEPISSLSMAGGIPVEASDIIAKATVALVALNSSATLARGRFCSGTILSNEWILTATHCVLGEDAAHIGVVFVPRDGNDGYGAANLRKVERIVYRSDHRLIEVCGDGKNIEGNSDECEARVEPQYPTYDIALLHLTSPTPDGVVFAQLPTPLDLFSIKLEVVAAGYGMHGPTIAGDGSLRKVTSLRIEEEWPNSLEFLVRNSLDEGPCPGDSGGPLYAMKDRSLTVLGVVSRGPDNCGSKGLAVVYSDLRKNLEWISCQLNVDADKSASSACFPFIKLTNVIKRN